MVTMGVGAQFGDGHRMDDISSRVDLQMVILMEMVFLMEMEMEMEMEMGMEMEMEMGMGMEMEVEMEMGMEMEVEMANLSTSVNEDWDGIVVFTMKSAREPGCEVCVAGSLGQCSAVCGHELTANVECDDLVIQ